MMSPTVNERNSKRGFLFLISVLILTNSVFAGTINVKVELASGQTVTPGGNIILNVLLEPSSLNLLSATAIFTVGGGFEFVNTPSLSTSGNIFPELDLNEIVTSGSQVNWVMSGTSTSGDPHSLNPNNRLGQLRVRVPATGQLQLSLDQMASEFYESSTVPHTIGTFTVQNIVVPVIVSGEIVPTCGDGTIDTGEVCDDDNTNNGDGCSSTCTVESGWACTGTPSTCSCAQPTVAGGTVNPTTCQITCNADYRLDAAGTACELSSTGTTSTTSLLAAIRIILENDSYSLIQKVSAIAYLLSTSTLITGAP